MTALATILSGLAVERATAGDWRVERLVERLVEQLAGGMVDGLVDTALFDEIGDPAPNGLPDGLVARHSGGDIVAAWYEDPTERYGHGILGDAIEAGSLVVERADGRVFRHVLSDRHVFEDRTPRLVDLDGDGKMEVVAIRSSLTEGGAIAVYGLHDGALVEKAVAGSIGTANRWLNVAGIADFLGTGDRQIAYVKTPHIGGTLIVYRYTGDSLERVGALGGFSNHAIGAREQRLSAALDLDGDGVPELAVPSADRKRLRLVGFKDGALRDLADIPLPARVERAIVVEETARGPAMLLGLADGGVYRVSR
jgi:hypothetical protein